MNGRPMRVGNHVLCPIAVPMDARSRPVVLPGEKLEDMVRQMRVYTITHIYTVYQRDTRRRAHASMSAEPDVFLKVQHRTHTAKFHDMYILDKSVVESDVSIIHLDTVAYKMKLVEHWDTTKTDKWVAIPIWPVT